MTIYTSTRHMNEFYITPHIIIIELEVEGFLCNSKGDGFDVGNHPGGWDNDSETDLNLHHEDTPFFSTYTDRHFINGDDFMYF